MIQTANQLTLDGNAAAGMMQELFSFEVTTATAMCDGCGQASQVGALLVYGLQLGAVFRCPGCDHVMMVVTRPHGDWVLDLRGVRVMQISRTATAVGR